MPGISDLLDSDVEGNNVIDENSILSTVSDDSDAGRTTTANGKKKTVRRHRVTMPKPKSRVTKSSPPAAKKVTKKAADIKRKAVVDAANTPSIAESQQEDISADEDVMEVEEKPRTKRKVVNKRAANKSRENATHGMVEEVEIDQTPMVARSSHAQSKTSKALPKVVKASNISTNKQPVKDIVISNDNELVPVEVEDEEEDEITVQQPPSKRARTESRTRQESLFRRRAGSASDTERGDPNLRRKLGDITRKFENIDMKYKNLKEVGISEANANVEKLRKQCEATTEASNNLIASLKKELAQQAPLIQDSRKLKRELQTRDVEITNLKASQADISAALTSAQNEVKALQAKLAAARTTPASVEPQPARVPGSAVKGPRTIGSTSSDAAQAAQVAQMKLDLYGDLTGLIVRSVKRAEDGDTFDCIQTGRNGTLHFKLFIDHEDAKSASFEDTEFLYTPLLDANRDADMIELMPPYLTEDITFARQNAAKFYQRVVDTLTRRTNEG